MPKLCCRPIHLQVTCNDVANRFVTDSRQLHARHLGSEKEALESEWTVANGSRKK